MTEAERNSALFNDGMNFDEDKQMSINGVFLIRLDGLKMYLFCTMDGSVGHGRRLGIRVKSIHQVFCLVQLQCLGFSVRGI